MKAWVALAMTLGLLLGSLARPVGAGDECDWLGDPELIARCELGGGSPGRGGLPPEWLEFGKGWRVEKVLTCPDGSPRIFRLLHWLDGDLWNDPVRATDFGWRFSPGDRVPNAPRRSDGSVARFAADNLVPDVPYCVRPLDRIDLSAEILERAPAGAPAFSPVAEGLTGLDTWLWYEGGTEIPPFRLRFTDPGSGITMELEAWATLEQFTWDMGDGGVVASTRSGSADDLPDTAAATYLYETKGEYTVTFTAGWIGTYRWRQLPGGAWSTPVPFAGNPATVTTTVVYPVVEVRSVLTP